MSDPGARNEQLADLLARISEHYQRAPDAPGPNRLLALLTDESKELDASRRRTTLHLAGEAMMARGRELVSDLGEHDLIGDDAAVVFAIIVAVGHRVM